MNRTRQRSRDRRQLSRSPRRNHQINSVYRDYDDPSRIQRMAALEQQGNLAERDREFQLDQTMRRAEIRIRDCRAKPIDLLVINMNLEREFIDLHMDSPDRIIDNLNLPELEEVAAEVDELSKLETIPDNIEFWKCMRIVCLSVIEKKQESIDRALASNKAIYDDILRILSNKSDEQLASLQASIETKLATQAATIDVEYWQALLKELKIHRARARIRELHDLMLEKRLALKSSSSVNKINPMQFLAPKEAPPVLSEVNSPVKKMKTVLPEETVNFRFVQEKEKQLLPHELNGQQNATEFEEVAFSDEISIQESESNSLNRALIKPQYKNVVLLDVEWNRYNLAHYTADNPPPKRVFGYKFNIFYPNLSKTPSFTIKKDPNDTDFTILTFKADSLFSDLAFRIESGEWDLSSRYGHLCTFDRGVLKLHFKFRRQRYRR